jgi:hypothetical protein
MSQNLEDYRRGVRNLEWLQADDTPSPHLEAMVRERLDEMWYELTDDEKDKAPRIPFRTNKHDLDTNLQWQEVRFCGTDARHDRH